MKDRERLSDMNGPHIHLIGLVQANDQALRDAKDTKVTPLDLI
jgi:hypothetical protein